MTKRKAGIRFGKHSQRFLRCVLLLLIGLSVVVGLVWWAWPRITSWVAVTASNIWGLLDWGLLVIVVALGTLIGLLRSRRYSSLIHHWNRWVSGITFLTAIWGILSLLGIGGRLGLSIRGQGITGSLRVAGMVILGIILASPRLSFKLARNLFSGLIGRFKQIDFNAPRRNMPKSLVRRPKSLEVARVKETTSAVLPDEPPRPDLRQVAEEVWEKYGKSASLVSVGGWKLPPVHILDKTAEVEFSQADNARRAKLIEESLSSYGVEAKVVQINTGPAVSQFGVEPGWDRKMREVKQRDASGNIRVRQEEVSRTRVKVERIISLSNDLALSLATASIRIEAPVPGKSMVGIEVPNATVGSVGLRGVIETGAFQRMITKSKLTVALGKGAGGEAVTADLAKMPHLLIAGATGSGKTVCLNTIVACLLMNNAPSELRFILIDPKRVELTPYNGIPHLASPVIVEANKAIAALRWLNHEMNRRYEVFAKVAVRDIEGYNKRQEVNRIPYLVLIIDELADLMMTGFDEVERLLCRLAQLSRATGIHLVVATQRPSVDVVTGLIKANFPTRISFAVTSQMDSRTILDIAGAEKLLGKGDMLFMPTEAAKPKRLQGCFVSDPEIKRLVYFWNSQRVEGAPSALKIDDMSRGTVAAKDYGTPADPLLQAARQLAKEHKQISVSFLQRKLRIGYPRAARLMEELEEEGNKGTEED